MSNLPERVVVGRNGAYWRDFGTHYSMCPTSEDNHPVEILAVYEQVERSARAAPLNVERLEFALHEHYGEGKDDTCWHSHDAERVARIYERAIEYGYVRLSENTDQ